LLEEYTIKIIGISGGSGSGKTYLSNKLIDNYGKSYVEIIELDSYYKDLSHMPFSKRERENFDHPDAFDFELLINNLEELKNHNKVLIPTYNYKTHTRNKKKKIIKKKRIIIIEGIFSILNKQLRKHMDYMIFIDVNEKIRLQRRIERDVNYRGRTLESIKLQYNKSVKPMHDKFVEPSKRFADVTINNNNSYTELIMIINGLINE